MSASTTRSPCCTISSLARVSSSTQEHSRSSSSWVLTKRTQVLSWRLWSNVKIIRPCEKLDYERVGPFVISGQINNVAYCLSLPSHMHLHKVFQVSLFKPYVDSSNPNRGVVPIPPQVQLVNGPKFKVKVVLDPKIVRNRPNDHTWELVEKLNNASELIISFYH